MFGFVHRFILAMKKKSNDASGFDLKRFDLATFRIHHRCWLCEELMKADANFSCQDDGNLDLWLRAAWSYLGDGCYQQTQPTYPLVNKHSY